MTSRTFHLLLWAWMWLASPFRPSDMASSTGNGILFQCQHFHKIAAFCGLWSCASLLLAVHPVCNTEHIFCAETMSQQYYKIQSFGYPALYTQMYTYFWNQEYHMKTLSQGIVSTWQWVLSSQLWCSVFHWLVFRYSDTKCVWFLNCIVPSARIRHHMKCVGWAR
jgi:hypothetical protein